MLLQNVKNIFPITLTLLHFLYQICRPLLICLVGIPVKYIYDHIQVKLGFLSPLVYDITILYFATHDQYHSVLQGTLVSQSLIHTSTYNMYTILIICTL